MRTTTLTIILLTSVLAFGQYPRQKALLEIIKPDLKELHDNKVDSISFFMPYFVGAKRALIVDRSAPKEKLAKLNCENTDEIFLLWQKNGKTYVTKYNECGKVKTITSDTITFLQHITKNFDIIKNTKVKPFQLVNEKKDTLTSMVDHRGIWEVTVEFTGKKYSNKIDLYDLNPTSNQDKNINAEYNNNLILVRLLDRLNRQLYSIKFN